MELKEIGEFGFIERFSSGFKSLLPDNVIGIGDDCAVLPLDETSDLLVTTDMLIEDIHFLRDKITPWQLGYKSVAVNLSDIAAMGGTPLGTFLSIAVPPGIDVEYLDQFMDGYRAVSNKYVSPLYGGDTTKSAKYLSVNVCAIGKCPRGKAKLRSNAQSGDLICVTGYLGDSAGGLKAIQENTEYSADIEYLLQRHHLPEPRITEGLVLSSFDGVNAMMDISDGIASDLPHILKASGKSARVQLDRLPLSDPLKRISVSRNWNTEELASAGGEDYELLFTVSPDELEKVELSFKEKSGKPLYQIGIIGEGKPEIYWYRNEHKVDFLKKGFNHFTGESNEL